MVPQFQIWRSLSDTIISKKLELQLGVISTAITLSVAILLLIIRHQQNAIIWQCCCLMQRKAYMDLRIIFLWSSSLSTISVHYKNLRFLSWQLSHYKTQWPHQRTRMGRGWIPSPLQKVGTWRFQLVPYKRRSTGDHTGTISGTDAGTGNRIQTPDPGSVAQRSSVKTLCKTEKIKNLFVFAAAAQAEVIHSQVSYHLFH